jgi:hypothetical protein
VLVNTYGHVKTNHFAMYLEANDESPFAPRVLAPCVGGHEGPVGESVFAVVVFWSSAEDHRPESGKSWQ